MRRFVLFYKIYRVISNQNILRYIAQCFFVINVEFASIKKSSYLIILRHGFTGFLKCNTFLVLFAKLFKNPTQCLKGMRMQCRSIQAIKIGVGTFSIDQGWPKCGPRAACGPPKIFCSPFVKFWIYYLAFFVTKIP